MPPAVLPSLPSGRSRAGAALALALLPLAALTACSGDEPGPAETVTVTSTPSAGAGSSAPPASTAPPEPESDVNDRAHDVGTFVGVDDQDGTLVLTLDRFTYADWSEEKVASEGVPVEPLTENPFRNQNATSTYRVPVAADAAVVLNSCVAADGSQPRLASEVGGLDDLAVGDTVWILTYSEGRLTRAETAAPC